MCHWMHFLDLQKLDRWLNGCSKWSPIESFGWYWITSRCDFPQSCPRYSSTGKATIWEVLARETRYAVTIGATCYAAEDLLWEHIKLSGTIHIATVTRSKIKAVQKDAPVNVLSGMDLLGFSLTRTYRVMICCKAWNVKKLNHWHKQATKIRLLPSDQP